jgi:mono/diheme cytochrome c family protein
MIVRRGFVKPPSLHDERLRNSPPGYFADVIAHGFGAMYSYGDRVPPEDRWKIAAYVKTLQLSRGADLAMLSPEDRERTGQAAATPDSAGASASNGQQTKEARP